MQQIKTVEDVRSLGTILTVWAHPDDETFTCAGIMAAAIANGQRVVCVTATKGEVGVQDENRWPQKDLATIRSHELASALSILGIKEHHWLDYKDGQCDKADEAVAIERIAKIIEEVNPQTILTFGLDGLTGHPDHIAIAKWVTSAWEDKLGDSQLLRYVELADTYEKYLKNANEKLNIYFNIEQPPLSTLETADICFCLNEHLLKIKLSALEAMPSQTERFLNSFNDDFFSGVFGHECFVKAVPPPERNKQP